MIKIKALVFSSVFLLTIASAYAQIPHLKMNEFGAVQLFVHGKPFLMISGIKLLVKVPS